MSTHFYGNSIYQVSRHVVFGMNSNLRSMIILKQKNMEEYGSKDYYLRSSLESFWLLKKGDQNMKFLKMKEARRTKSKQS